MNDLYIARGYQLVPVDGKSPRVKNWPSREFTAEDIEQAQSTYAEPGVGIKLDGLLDFDGDTPEAALMAESLDLPETVAWQSARGRHELFSLTAEQSAFFATAGKIVLNGLELRTGIASQSVLPPSAGRTWLVSLDDCDPVKLPDSVFEKIKELAKPKTKPEPVEYKDYSDDDRPLARWDRKVAEDWSIFTAAVLDPLHYTYVGPNAGGGELYRHPTATQKQSLVIGNTCTPEGIPHVHAYSPNCHGLPQKESVTPHRALAIMLFDEDYRTAIRYLGDGVIDRSCKEFDALPEIESFPEPEIVVKQENTNSSIYTTVSTPVKDKHPRLDLHQFKDPLTNYCLALEDKSAADIGAIWFQIHELLAGFIGRNPHFIWSFKPYYTNGSLFVVGPTATGKKGLSLFAAKAPFVAESCGEFSDDIEFLNFKNSIAGGWQSGQAILTHFAKEKNDTEEKDRRLVLVEEETATLLKMAKMEGSILSQVMRTAYDGGSLEYRVSKLKGAQSTVKVDDAHVSLIGHITASELLQLLTVGADQTGELNRIQFILCLDSKFVPEAKANFLLQDVEELTTLRGHILQCYKWAQKRRITFSNDLAQLLDEYTEKHDLDLRAGREKPINARLPLYLRKWIARFAVLDMTEIANITHYTKAMAVIEYLHAANDYLLGEWLDGVDKDSIDKAILTVQESPAGVTRAAIGKELFGTHWTVDKVEGVLAHARKRLALIGKTLKEKKDRNKVIYSL